MRREVNRIRIAAWAMLIAQAGIIFTGGIVRLTGSGLGCTDWPKCTPDSFVATKAMGIHGAIEFGNDLDRLVAEVGPSEEATIGVADDELRLEPRYRILDESNGADRLRHRLPSPVGVVEH